MGLGSKYAGAIGNNSQTTRNTPYPIGSGFKQIAAGAYHSLGIRQDGSLWAWGWNQYGQLGDGTTIDKLKPVRVGDGFIQVVANYQRTFALKADGSLWGWGANYGGELGDGTHSNRLTPTLIGYWNFSKIATGNDHTLALKGDQTLWAWGANQYGQLGTGNQKDILQPIKIGDGYIDIQTGGAHSVALKTNGILMSWGVNNYGQLGTGNNTSTSLPIAVENRYQKLVTTGGPGVDTLFAVAPTGLAWVSGRNDSGQLALGNTSSVNRPVRLDSGHVDVAIGNIHSLSLKPDGSLRLWGGNSSGQLGDGTYTQRNMPVKVVFNDMPIKPVATTYTDFSGKTQSLFAWEGRYVAILSKSSTLSSQVMSKWLAAVDHAYQYYWWTTGFRPDNAKTYNGKLVIAEASSTCGAGCGYLNATGIELHSSYFSGAYENLSTKNQYDQISFYELGRNFWSIERMDKKIGVEKYNVATAYAVAMRFFSMDAGKLPGTNFRNWTFPEFKQRASEMLDYYTADSTQNWQNTIASGKAQANNPSNLSSVDLFASFS
jgi:alpha-tubulin suppressor-like RCC1 family protein